VGGYADPAERDTPAVRKGVEQDYITREEAQGPTAPLSSR
jgi:N-methylhydantoinase B/oxoprolinase/acetone carboxylase alpha subunit